MAAVEASMAASAELMFWQDTSSVACLHLRDTYVHVCKSARVCVCVCIKGVYVCTYMHTFPPYSLTHSSLPTLILTHSTHNNTLHIYVHACT